MKEALERARHLKDALGIVTTAADEAPNEADRWRLEGLKRCLHGIRDATAFADKGALLREATRLADGSLSLPIEGSGLNCNDLPLLSRFGLEARIEDGDRLSLLLTDSDPLPEAIAHALRLDPAPRRPYKTAIGDALLRRFTEFSTYRTPTQKAAVRALITMPPAATLSVTMPTGAGKSLIFQLAVQWWRQFDPGACVAVIVPTIALAQDHERTLRHMEGLSASRALTSELTPDERDAVLRAFNRGEVPILLLSPELALERARESLLTAAKPPDQKPLAAKGRLLALVVDEAHIVESWGRSFRPDFQRLPALLQQLRAVYDALRVVLLSATLGDQARVELKRAYGRETPFLEIDAKVPRYELDVASVRYASAEARDAELLCVVDRLPRPALIYTTKVEDANRLYRVLKRERGYQRIAVFTGAISNSRERREIVNAWSEDRLDLVVATSAFGLGIDKANVRAVVHACVPEGIARYYQEIGRAARDGHQALALCMWYGVIHSGRTETNDVSLAFGLATRQWMTVQKCLQRWEAIRGLPDAVFWQKGRQFIDVNLDALRDGLGSESSEYNRVWNMTLLNLLQRAEAVSIELLEQEDFTAPTWRAEVRNPRIFDASTEHGVVYLRELFSLREEEKQQSRDDVRRLVDILRNPKPTYCLLADIYSAVEAGHSSVKPCGHCAWCRSVGAVPPSHVVFEGLAVTWPDSPDWAVGALPAVPIIVNPEDPSFSHGLRKLLSALSDAGVEQFVVPDQRAGEIVDALAVTSARAGLVLESTRLVDASGWALANLPTAALLEADFPSIDPLYTRLHEWHSANPQQNLVLVAPSDLMVNGKRLEQFASAMPAYSESHIAAMERSIARERRSLS